MPDSSGGAFFYSKHGHFWRHHLTSGGDFDCFLAHVNSTGVIDWAVRAGGQRIVSPAWHPTALAECS